MRVRILLAGALTSSVILLFGVQSAGTPPCNPYFAWDWIGTLVSLRIDGKLVETRSGPSEPALVLQPIEPRAGSGSPRLHVDWAYWDGTQTGAVCDEEYQRVSQ